MLDLGLLPLLILAAAALLAGFSKTALSGVAAVAVALFAAVLPAKESTGALLPLLLAGDLIAVRAYRRHADRPTLLRLFPSVAAGVLLGAAFTAIADDTLIRRTIGALLLSITVHHVWQQRAQRRRTEHPSPPTKTGETPSPKADESAPTKAGCAAPTKARGTLPTKTTEPAPTQGSGGTVPPKAGEPAPTKACGTPAAQPAGTLRTAPPAPTLPTGAPQPHTANIPRPRTALYGLMAGFATMVANAGGPAMSVYLLASGLGMLGFLGTAAWFFFLVNAFKVPFSVGLGLLTPDVLLLDAVLLPAVLLGAYLGRRCIHRLNQPLFTHLTLALTTLSSLNLLR